MLTFEIILVCVIVVAIVAGIDVSSRFRIRPSDFADNDDDPADTAVQG